MSLNISGNTHFFDDVYIVAVATTAGKVESSGPLKNYFDKRYPDHHLGYDSYELAEMKMLEDALTIAREKVNLNASDIQLYIGGDLNNQLTSSHYVARLLPSPMYGVYSACATLGQSIQLASLLVSSGHIKNSQVFVSSHNATAERQFRYPNEYGIKKRDTSTFTATGGVSVILDKTPSMVRIESITIGRVIDMQQKNVNDMGRAMAPAAFDTLKQHLLDTKRKGTYYDLIITGDLSTYGKKIMQELIIKENIEVNEYTDCGCLLYSDCQDVNMGGSGPTCSGLVTFGYLYKKMCQGIYKRILVLPTGALLSPVMVNQKQSIPCVSHAFCLEVVQ